MKAILIFISMELKESANPVGKSENFSMWCKIDLIYFLIVQFTRKAFRKVNGIHQCCS